MPPRPGYRWNAKSGRYISPSGRFVSQEQVRAALDRAVANAGKRAVAFSQELRAGQITLEEWRTAMRVMIKDVHLYSAAAARGGWAQMTPQAFGQVGAQVAKQYAHLEGFVQQIGQGLPLGGGFLRRVQMYTQAGRETFHLALLTEQIRRGFTEERNVLHPADHCDECADQSAAGWVPIGTLVPIGQRQCLVNCRCSMKYR